MYLYLGISLFTLFLFQEIMDWKWQFLLDLQQQQTYKKWTGLIVILYILTQWLLSFVKGSQRITGRRKRQLLHFHQWNGALAPLYFYIHSVGIGYGYLLFLSLVYLGNFLVGLFHTTILKLRNRTYYLSWLSIHIALSVFIVTGALLHIWVVYYFE